MSLSESLRVSGQDGPPAGAIEMSWGKSTTPLEAVERALYALADEATGTTTEGETDWQVQVHPRAATADRERLSHRMRQEVTDQTLRLRIAERTDPIRNLVFALAFSRSPQQDVGGASDQGESET